MLVEVAGSLVAAAAARPQLQAAAEDVCRTHVHALALAMPGGAAGGDDEEEDGVRSGARTGGCAVVSRGRSGCGAAVPTVEAVVS